MVVMAANPTVEGDGAIALAAWPEKELLFATYDLSPIITWASTNALVNLGDFNTEATGYYGFGGSPMAFRDVNGTNNSVLC